MSQNTSDRLPDLTRWNRAGLTRFEYVDGDAAVWLEELRIAMLGLFLRRKDPDQRVPEIWRDAFMGQPDDWPALKDETPTWARLKSDIPAEPETPGARSDRLLDRYDTLNDGDHAWEINRAFARATHVLLGYLDAYANEGYLRTATQWENLRRLAAMVNYQPTPPASAITTIALTLYEDTDRAEIDRGLAMKFTPPEGGAPLVFETLDKLTAHSDLNSVRVEDWNVNGTELVFGTGGTPSAIAWHADEKLGLAVGELVVLKGPTSASAEVFTIVASNRGKTDGERLLTFDGLPAKGEGSAWLSLSQYRLLTTPQDVRRGVRRTRESQTVVEFENGPGFVKGDVLRVVVDGVPDYVEVLDATGDRITLDAGFGEADSIQAEALAPYTGTAGVFQTHAQTSEVRYRTASGVDKASGTPVKDEGETIAMSYTPANMTGDTVFARVPDAKSFKGKIERPGIVVVPGRLVPVGRTVAFDGKPPKDVRNGDWFIARDVDTNVPKALKVVGLQTASERYYIEFHAAPNGAHEDTEFHGPLTESLRPVGHDHNPEPAFTAGKARLIGLSTEASALLKPGRTMILSNADGTFEQAKLTSAAAGDKTVEISVDPLNAASGWAAGDTRIHLNCALISHGETKGAQTLGSGDGERSAQSFSFTPKDISHVPSTVTESGVVPDRDVVVEGETWDYRDLVDPTAEGTRAWSSILNEDGTLTILFRRRLPTGQNNVTVNRHRVGTGLKGSNVPALSFEKPMKKHRYVEKVLQPFKTSGGSDREAVSDLRTSTPQRLAANGRAVSLRDFEGLAIQQSSVLRAMAEHLPGASATQEILLTLALKGGATLTETLEDTLRPAILAKTIPGVRLSFADYDALLLNIEAIVRADLTAHDKTDIKAACEAALQAHFELNARGFGQAAYRSEVLAVLETVPGIETAQATGFGLADSNDTPESISIQNGVTAAIFPAANQIAHVGAAITGAIRVEVEDIR